MRNVLHIQAKEKGGLFWLFLNLLSERNLRLKFGFFLLRQQLRKKAHDQLIFFSINYQINILYHKYQSRLAGLKEMNRLKRMVSRRQAKWLFSGLIGIYSINTYYQGKIWMDSNDSRPQHQKQMETSTLQSQSIGSKVKSEEQKQVGENSQQTKEQLIINQGNQPIQNRQQNEKQVKTGQNDKQEDNKKESQEIQVQKDESNLKSKIRDLETNCAIVSSKISKQIRSYLERLNVKVQEVPYQTFGAHQVWIKNQIGDTKKFNLNSFQYFRQSKQQVDELFILNNFLNCPKLIKKQQQFLDLFQHLENDENIVLTILQEKPSHKSNQFDTYHQRKYKEPRQIKQKFMHLKYNSTSNKDMYIMINRDVGKLLRIDQLNAGKVYILNKMSKYSAKNISNISINGHRCSIRQQQYDLLQKNVEENKNYDLKFNFSSLTLATRSIYEPKTENDIDNLIRQIKMHPPLQGNVFPKMLVINNQDKNEQFLNKVEKVLLQTKKMMKEQVVICKIENPKLLEYLTIIPDGYATVRLIQFNKYQNPPSELLQNASIIRKEEKKNGEVFFSRYKLQGPFNPANLCQFIQSQSNKQYYEVKYRVPNVFEISAGQMCKLKHSLVLFEKFGCAGCNYVKQIMEELDRIIEKLAKQKSQKIKQDVKFTYQIQQPDAIKGLTLKRYNILNEEKETDKILQTPQVTPQLYYVSNGKHCDLRIAQIFSTMNKFHFNTLFQGQQQYDQAKQNFLKQVIQRVTQCKSKII